MLALLAASLLAVPAWGAKRAAPIAIQHQAPRPSESVQPITVGGIQYLSANDLARVFGATKFWRPELRKLTLRLGNHTVRLTVDAPIVMVDEEAKYLVHSPRLIQGTVYVPEPLLAGLFEWNLIEDAIWDAELRVVRFRSAVHTVRQAQLWVRGHVTEVSAALARSPLPRVLYATPTEIRILLEDATLDTSRVFAGGVITAGAIEEVPAGVEIRLILDDDAKGYSVATGANRLRVAVTDEDDLVSAGLFNELAPLPLGGKERKLRTIVIDPGHGGRDHGSSLPGGLAEKDMALEIARLLRSELARRFDAHVMLTREGDADVGIERRAEISNEVQADLFISVHVDASGALRSGGFRVLSPAPGGAGEAEARVPISERGDRSDEPAAAELVPWRSAQLRQAGTSMAVGQAIADGLRRSFPQSPVIVRSGRLGVLAPVLCPAVLLECSPSPRTGPEAMSLRGYTLQEVARIVSQSLHDLSRGERI